MRSLDMVWSGFVRRVRVLAFLGGIMLCCPLTASAQLQDLTPIGPLVADVRGAFPRYGPTPELVAPYEIAATDVPSYGVGLDVGAHWYPFRWRSITFGVGGSLLLSAGHSGVTEQNGTVTGHDVDVHFIAVSPQLSFNFGSGKGWSYVSGGLGYSTMTIATETILAPDMPTKRKTINYGGGARWFSRKHVAFTLDMRFYAINPQEATNFVLTAPRVTLLVLSAGVSLK